ncbi:hypothetical protein B2J93_8562 [Marssonina coronariae]|uniref:Uncharacterized protein n=1 Tax=Diplocarpon coronariae TaxID=2795749 RepID=A0A218YXB9_9HELO|nr:hypothetical protein B2J93_8562 [Marssonina coronariae]
MAHNRRDYSREDYAPRDQIEVVYNLETRVLSYRPHSQIFFGRSRATMKSIPIPRIVREVRIALPRDPDDPEAEDKGGVVKLPKRVWVGRNLLGDFRDLFLEG